MIGTNEHLAEQIAKMFYDIGRYSYSLWKVLGTPKDRFGKHLGLFLAVITSARQDMDKIYFVHGQIVPATWTSNNMFAERPKMTLNEQYPIGNTLGTHKDTFGKQLGCLLAFITSARQIWTSNPCLSKCPPRHGQTICPWTNFLCLNFELKLHFSSLFYQKTNDCFTKNTSIKFIIAT